MPMKKGNPHRFQKGNTHGWKKGQSGNPTGQLVPKEILEIFKAACPDAARKLCELIHHKDPHLAARAAEYIINRVHGRPRESVEVKGEIAQFVALLPAVIDKAEVWEAKVQKAIGATEH